MCDAVGVPRDPKRLQSQAVGSERSTVLAMALRARLLRPLPTGRAKPSSDKLSAHAHRPAAEDGYRSHDRHCSLRRMVEKLTSCGSLPSVIRCVNAWLVVDLRIISGTLLL